MKAVVVLFASLMVSSLVWALDYPTSPDPQLTPGSYCKGGSQTRYPERVKVCRRTVDAGEKWQVIDAYVKKGGYKIDKGNRNQFKIDHLIPLCAGGGNTADNLWPQHESVYLQTDPLEPLACEKMAAGRLTQKRAVELIFKAKFDLSKIPEVMQELNSL